MAGGLVWWNLRDESALEPLATRMDVALGKAFIRTIDDAWPRMSRLSLQGIEIDIPRFSSETETERYLRPFEYGTATIPRGQSGRLLAVADLTARQIPDSCLLSYRSQDNRQGRASLRRLNPQESTQLPFVLEGPPLESIDQDYALSLQGGDVRIAGLRLQVIEAPQLNELRLQVRYPEYLRRRSSSLWLDETLEYRTGLRLPEGPRLPCSEPPTFRWSDAISKLLDKVAMASRLPIVIRPKPMEMRLTRGSEEWIPVCWSKSGYGKSRDTAPPAYNNLSSVCCRMRSRASI